MITFCVLYAIGGLIGFVLIARDYFAATGKDDYLGALILGGLAAVIWPFSVAVAGCLFLYDRAYYASPVIRFCRFLDRTLFRGIK